MTSIIIPNSVTDIGEGAFDLCEKLSSINIPSSVKTIDKWTFSRCSSLTSIEIPNTIICIEKEAFKDCKNLANICIPNSIRSIDKDAFSGCEKLNITVPYGFPTEDFKEAFKGCISLSREIKANNQKYYIVDQKNEYGLKNTAGEWIVLPGLYTMIEPAGGNYLRVKDKNQDVGIITVQNKVIISTSRKYSNISDYNSTNKKFIIQKGNYTGECNENGIQLSLKKIPPTIDEIKANGGYASAVEMKNGSTKYYKVSKGGSYGLTNSEGKEIVPCEMEALESAGTGYLKYKINGFWGLMNYTGKILIGTERGYTSIGNFVTFTKRFPYTMAGWKGECDINGRQISKIKVDTPQQAVAKKETAIPKKEEKKEEKVIIIEHQQQPQQRWYSCGSCGGLRRCTTCNGTQYTWSGNSQFRCYNCNGTGICPSCNGQGGWYSY